jgi:hypothetical protein
MLPLPRALIYLQQEQRNPPSLPMFQQMEIAICLQSHRL